MGQFEPSHPHTTVQPGVDANPVAQIGQDVDQAFLELLAVQSGRVPYAVVLCVIVIAALAYEQAESSLLMVWLFAVFALLGLRYITLNRLASDSDQPIGKRINVAVILSGVNGLTHAFCLYFFPDSTDLERSMISLLLLGMCTGAVLTTAGYSRVFLAYVTPNILLLAALWAINPGEEFAWRHAATAGLVLAFGGLLVILARDTYRQFRASYQIREEHLALSQQLRNALDDSEAANAAKTRFLAAASHDLRQPVHALDLFISGLIRRPLDEKSRVIAEHAKSSITMLSSQLAALLDVSRLDAGMVVPDLGACNLTNLIARVRAQSAPQAEEKGLILVAQCPDDVFVFCDEILLERIVDNLLSNAIKYTDSGQVRIEVQELDTDRCRLSVIDSGRGIPDAEQSRVFEEFYQIDNPSRDKAKGLGLGLSIVRRLTQLLDLGLSFESSEGHGSSFTLEIPTTSSRPQPVTPHKQPTLEGRRVLAVDDEPDVLRGLRVALESRGCLVDTAPGTEAAMELARSSPPDVLVCDYRLASGDSGLKTVTAIRGLLPTLPVILITGDTAPDRLRDAAQADVLLLHKPVGDERLATTIAQAIG